MPPSNPLLNDDPYLNTQAGLELSGSSGPLGLGSPLRNGGAAPTMQPSATGMGQLQSPEQFQQTIGSIFARPTPTQTAPSQAQIFYSPSTGDIVVNGAEPFSERNASMALASEQWANQPGRRFTLPDTATDWREMPREEYNAYLETIKNPSYGRRMGEAWEHAWRGMGDIGVGAGLATDRLLTGDEDNEWFLEARANLRREYEENAPFLMQLRDVENVNDALTYTSQMLVQGVPWLIETAVSMGAGALIGGAVSGGVGAPAGAVEGFIANQALHAATRNSIRTVLRNNIRRGATAYAEAQAERGVIRHAAELTRDDVLAYAARTSTASADDVNRFFNFGERAYHMSRGGQTGAITAMFGSNYMTGVGDIRNSIEDAGGDPESADAVANIWGMAIPYALLESAGDLIITQPLTHIGPDILNATARSARLVDQAAARGSNMLRGAGVVGAAEGLEEGGQYIVTQQGIAGATHQPVDIEPMDLLENIIGGAVAGAGLGGASYAFKTPNRPLADGGLSTPPAPAPSTPPSPGPMDSGSVFGPDATSSAAPGMETGPSAPPAYMGGLTVPNIDPAFGTSEDTSAAETEAAMRAEEQAMRSNAIGARTPEEIFQGLQNNEPASQFEMYILRRAIRALQAANPTNPGYTEVISQLDQIEADQAQGLFPYTPQEEQVNWDAPDLSPVDPNQGIGTFQQPTITNRNAPVQDTNPIMPDGLPKYGQHRLKGYVDQQGVPTGNMPNADELRGRTEEEPVVGKNAKKNKKRKNKLKRKLATRPFVGDAETDEQQRELDNYIASTPFGRQSQRREERHQGQDLPVRGVERAMNAEREYVADRFSGDSHNAWLAQFRKDNPTEANKPRMRERGGAMVDINKPWNELDPRAQADNRTAAEAAYDAYRQYPDDIERGSAYIHDKWVERNRDDESIDESLLLPYDKLTEIEQEKDRAHWRRVRDIITPPRPKKKTKAEPETKLQPAPEAEDEVSVNPSTNRIKAAAQRAKEAREAASIKAEPVEATDARQEAAYKQGMRNYKDVYKLLQGARGKLGRSKKFSYEGQRDLPLKTTDASRWIEVSGVALSYNELQTLIERVRAEFTASEKTERSARVFHDYVNDAWQQNKNDPKHFATFISGAKVEEVTNWLSSEVSKLLPPARKAAQEILTSFGDKPSQASLRPPTTVTAILRRVLTENPDFTFKSVHPATRAKSRAIVDEIHAAQRASEEQESSIEQLGDSLSAVKKRMQLGEKQSPTKQAEYINRIDQKDFKPMKKSEVSSIVKGVQQRIFQEFRFRSVHIFIDMKDFWDRAKSETMTARNGAKYTIADYMKRQGALLKLEVPEFAHLSEAEAAYVYADQYIKSRAAVSHEFDALFVFAGHMESRRELLEVLEHEYLAHKGLDVLFESQEQRRSFLGRLLSVPGMLEKREELVALKPTYRAVPRLAQVEEVLAHHMMEGPLALEALLSAPQAFDPVTKRSLWEDFKQLVMDWINRVFFGYRSDADQALDAVTAAMREYVMTGNKPDLHRILDKFATFSKEDVDALVEQADPSDLNIAKAALAAATAVPQETYDLLHGTPDDSGRPYQQRPWQEDVIASATSDKEIMAKLHEIATGKVATPIKEGLKKIARELATMTQMRMESPLIEKMMEIMDNTIKRARFLITTWNDARPHARLEAITNEWRARWGDKAPGSTKAQREAYGRMAIVATNSKLAKLSDAMVRAAPRLLVRHPDGTYTINHTVFEKLLKQGTFSKEDFLKGIEQFTVDSEGNVTSAGVAKLTKEQIEAGYDIYLIETRLMAESALATLEAATVMLSQKNNSTVARLIKENKFKESDQAFVNEALQRMYKLYTDIAFHEYTSKTVKQQAAQADRARQVLIELMRTFHEEKKVADWTDTRMQRDETAKSPRKNGAFKWREQVDPHEDVKPFVDQIRWFLEYDDTAGASRLARINGLGVSDNRQYQMLGAFQSLLNSETLAQEKENKIIQSILGNYVEMTRKGKWRIAFEVYEEDGKTRAEVSPVLLAKLPVLYAESEREANAFQAEFGQEFGDKLYTVNDVDGELVSVKFDVSVAMAPGQATMTDAPDIEGFLKVSELAGVKFSATAMKKITQLIANASIRKRFGLQRAGSPGMDADILRNNSETMTQRAWEAAKTSESHMLEEELADERNRYGDWHKLENLQRKFDIANRGAPEGVAPPITFVRNKDAVIVAEQELLRYANQLRHVSRRSLKNPVVPVRTTRGEDKLRITGEAEAYITHAKAMRESLEKNELELNLNDLISKTGALRQMAVVSQLGTIAAGVMNAFTPITTLPARLMAAHNKTGYGDGFGLSEVISEIMAALSQVMTTFKGYGDTVMLKKILDAARDGNNTTGLTLAELEAMYAETLNGKLTPQQTYSLTGGTESNIRNLWYRTISNILLKPFSSVEAATRRVAFLASYRLLKKRYIAAGLGTEEQFNDPTSDQYKKLIAAIESVIDDSQGDYNNINRPRAFRGDMAQYVLQYKMFPLMMVQLINNLPMAQKGVVLGTLFLLGGLKGEPFADDFMDIYDTAMQKLGLQHDSLELSMVQFFEDLLPGSSKWIMHGAIDAVAFGGTMSSRLAMGDIIPLTGLFRPEADVGREVTNAFGPAFAANIDAIEWASIVTDLSLEVMGMRPRTTPWEDLFRKFPQGQVRALGESIQMATTGQILDPRGRLTSDEVNIYNVFSRALGFYPLEASRANDTVRLDRMHTGYMRNIRTRFVLAYARAYRADNEADMERIIDEVRDWNEAVELTGQDDMLIRNFRSAAVRAGRAASQTAIERTSQSAPDYSVIDELALATGADTETDEEE